MANHNSDKPENLLVIDIETVPVFEHFSDLPELWKQLWADKVSKTMPENKTVEEWYEDRAGILSEFGKIICISTGLFYTDKGGRLCLRVKSFYHKDEKQLLAEFIRKISYLAKKNPQFSFAGHNIKEFDIPYICRRCFANNIPLPAFLQFSNKKPWETNLVDTMQFWRFGDYKNYTPLNLLAAVLGIETPKDDIDGSKVKEVYYKEKNLKRIVSYCEKDVVATARILLRFENGPDLPQQNIFKS